MDMIEQELTWVDRSDLLRLATVSAFVYRMRDHAGVIIYVGKTINEPGARFASHRTMSSWWGETTSAEVSEVPAGEANSVEADEIHRWHPKYNRTCVRCNAERSATAINRHPMYPLWGYISHSRKADRCERWADFQAFVQDIEALGPKPGAEYGLRLIDPDGVYEPGNVHWGTRSGPYKR